MYNIIIPTKPSISEGLIKGNIKLRLSTVEQFAK